MEDLDYELSLLRLGHGAELVDDALERARASWKPQRRWRQPAGEHTSAQIQRHGMLGGAHRRSGCR